MRKRLTRAEIKEGLKANPIENILLGATTKHGVNLTKKQKDFAKKVAQGMPKTQAYRETYDTEGKPSTQSVEAHKLSRNPKVANMIEAFRVANEAREYLLPEQLKTLATQNLVTILTTEEEKTSNKLKAIELIGKMAEVSMFQETKTHVHLHTTTDIKGKLIEGLRMAFQSSRLDDLAKRKANSLLVELADPQSNQELTTPTECHPPKFSELPDGHLHTISHNQSPIPSDLTITPVIVTGEGASEIQEVTLGEDIEMTPLIDSEQK